MRNPRLPRFIFVLLALLSLVYFWRLYSQLPDVLASHFNGSGVPNGWMPKADFFKFLPLAGALIAAIAFLSPKLLAILPPSMVNLPNKDYRLAPERRAETVQYFEAALGWFGCAIFSLILFAAYNAIQANLHPARGFDSSSILVALGVFFGFVIFFIVRITGHFFRSQ